MAVVHGPRPVSGWQHFVHSLRKDFLFWVCVLLLLGVLCLVPQIGDVIFQTAQKSRSPQSAQILQGVAWVPFFYLVYLTLLFTGTAASMLLVVPPSFWSVGVRGARPVPPPVFSWSWFCRSVGVLSVLALGALLDVQWWLGPVHPWVYPWLPLLLLGLLLFPWVGYAVFWCSGFLVTAARRWPFLCRWWFGGGLLLGGLFLWGLLLGLDVNAWRQEKHPLGLVALNGLGLVLCLAGLWLSCVAWFASGKPSTEGGLTALGRLIGWLTCSWFGGEVIWLFASSQLVLGEGLAYRLYTIWAVLELLILVVLIGALLDTWEERANAPIRLAGILLVVLLTLVLHYPGTEELEPPTTTEARAAPSDWPQLFLNRIQQIPAGEPVVLVAASGGGSRAAIFSGLVLEALAREPFPGAGNKSWADHIVLISSVSGGSLGTARFVHGLGTATERSHKGAGSLHSSLRSDLVARMKAAADQLREQLHSGKEEQRIKEKFTDKPKVSEAFFADYKDALQRVREDDSEGDWPWVIQSPLMDDLCMDFMAPVLRGARMPLLSHGASLRLFWRDQLHLGDSNDRGGFSQRWQLGRVSLGEISPDHLQRDRGGAGQSAGSRFPTFAAELSHEYSTAETVGAREQLRYPPQTLADLDPERSIDLHQAVALSANFPYGFPPLTIPRHNASDGDTAPAKILDGGIVDNTGIDSIFFVLQALRAGKEAQDKTCGAVWAELENRRVLLVEISSGKKPLPPGHAASWLALLRAPATSLSNARFANAALAKQYYLAILNGWLQDQQLPSLRRQVEEVEKDFRQVAQELGANLSATTGPLRKRLQQLETCRAERFISLRFECNHFGQRNVQTAWSLGPEDKARVLVRFLIELHMHRNELKLWAGETIRKDADELVQQQLITFFCPLLGKALAQVAGDLAAIDRLGREGPRARKELQARLSRAEEHLNEAEQMVKRFQIDLDADVLERIKELGKGVRSGQVHLTLNTTLTDMHLKILHPAPLDSALRLLEPKLGQQQQTAELRVAELLPQLSPVIDWQTQLNLRALLSRELHDPTAPD